MDRLVPSQSFGELSPGSQMPLPSTASLGRSPTHLYLLQDLLGPLLLLASLALMALLELTRRQICALYQLTFLLTSVYAVVAIGGLVDHQFLNEELDVALYPAQIPSSLRGSFIYLPVVLACIGSVAFLLQLSTCSCDCCCLVGDGGYDNSTKSHDPLVPSSHHQHCFASRLRSNWSVYCGTFGGVFFCVGMRLNVRLRESAITPIGGTLHWQMLRSPFYWSVIHTTSLVLVLLKIFLQHADKKSTAFLRHLASHHQAARASSSMESSLEELMRPPARMPVSSMSKKASSSVHEQQQEDDDDEENDAEEEDSDDSAKASPPSIDPRSASFNRKPLSAESLAALPSTAPPALKKKPSSLHAASQSQSFSRARKSTPSRDSGGISSRISSGSDYEYDATKPMRQPTVQQFTSASSSSRRPSSSGYTTTTPTAGSSSMMRRPRVASNTSSSTFASDNELDGGFSSSSTRYERPRAPRAPIAPVAIKPKMTSKAHPTIPTSGVNKESSNGKDSSVASSAWIECIDATSGSVYFYNEATHESTWTRPAELVASTDPQHPKWQ